MKWKLKQHVLLALSIFIALTLSVTAWSVIQKLESDIHTRLGSYLTTQLNTTHQGVISSLKEHQASVSVWANTPEVRKAASSLLTESHDRQALVKSPAQAHLRAWLRPIHTAMGYQGYFIIGPDQINLASYRDQNIGQKSLLITQEDFFQKIWSGKTVISLPEKSDVPLPGKNGVLQEGRATMFVGAPVLDDTGKVIAAFTFRINPADDFTTILQQGRIGESGETYAFDRQGLLISNSRFNDQLRDIGLIEKNEEAILNLQIRDPGVNLMQGEENVLPEDQRPLTLMASKAVAGQSGINLDGYRDYRGVLVVGTWIWDDDLGFGITTELDADEAYQTFRATRYTIASLALLLILMLTGMITIQIVNRQRRQAQAALRESEERLRLLVEQADFHLWSIDRDLKFTQSLGGGLSNLGLRPNEVVGLTLYQFFQTESPEFPPLKAHLKALEGNQVNYETEWQGRYYQSQITPLYDADEKIVGCIGVAVDTTYRKQAEKALQRSEVLEELATGASLNEILTALVINAEKHSPDMRCSVLLLDADGKQLRHGAAPSLPDFFNEAIVGVEIGLAVGSCGEAAYTGERVIVEDIMSHPNWASYLELAEKADLRACWSEPIISSTGDILGTFAVYYCEPRAPTQSDLDFIRDSARLAGIAIERKQAEGALKDSEQKLRLITDNIPAFVAYVDSDLRYRFNNKKYEDWFGMSSEEIFGMHVKDVLGEAVYQRQKERYAIVLSGVSVDFELPIQFIDNKEHYVSGTHVPDISDDGEINGFFTFVTDITERKQAEEALQESEERYRSLTEATTSVVWTTDAHGEFVVPQKSWEEYTGQPWNEHKGFGWAQVLHEGDRERIQDIWSKAVADQSLYVTEGRIWCAAAREYHYFIVRAVPIKNPDGSLREWVGIIMDVNDRKQAEETTHKLLQQNRDLTQRMFQIQEEERRHLAHELHDEFGQWLTAIHLNAEAISQLSKEQSPDIHASARVIEESATEMHKNIRGMMRQLRPALLDELGLVESLKDLIDQWQAQHPAVDITLSLDGELDDFEDNLNITLYRIIQESLTNVAKYAGARDVAIQLIRQPGEAGEQDSLLLSVEDNGKGMDAEASTEGFGLAGMRERVLAVGGKFNIHTSPGKGVRIELRLPVNR